MNDLRQQGTQVYKSLKKQAAAKGMLATIQQSDLLSALETCKWAVDKRPTIPILGTALLEAGSDMLTLTSSNLEQSIRCTRPAQIAAEGSAAIPVQYLTRYLREVPSGELKLSLSGDDLTVKGDHYSATFTGMSKESFPTITERPAPQFEIEAADLRTAFQKVKFAISQEESRFTLSGALLQVCGCEFIMAAMDVHRMSYVRALLPFPAVAEVRFLIRLAAMKAALEILPELCKVQVSSDSDNLYFSCGSVALSSRKLTGNFPDYTRALPKGDTPRFIVDRLAMISAITRALVLADGRSRMVRSNFEREWVAMDAESFETGTAHERVPCECHGYVADVAVAFNGGYVLEALGSMTEERVAISVKDAKSALEITAVDAGAVQHRNVIMPMRS